MASAVALPPLTAHMRSARAVDHKGGDLKMPQAFRAITGGNCSLWPAGATLVGS